jgi:HK97 family phage prohead protease
MDWHDTRCRLRPSDPRKIIKEAAMQNRAYSILEVKSVDEDKRVIRGVATTPSVDRVGDIIEPEGVKFSNPMPLLWQHQHDKPIGHVKFDKPTKAGINFEAEIAKTDEPGTLKERLDEAWQSIKMRLVKAVSIGFRPVEYSFMENGGIRFSECEVYELSAVTIPANADALIQQIKSVQGDEGVMRALKAVDAEFRRQEGIPDPEIPEAPEPAATGKSVRVVKLDAPARDRAPFVINKIHPAKPAGRQK